MVYSTCSMNPIENEAVVVQLLQAFPGQIQLVDISERLPGLKTQPGLTEWCVMAKNKEVYRSVADVPSDLQSLLRPNMFPPSKGVLEQAHLERWSDVSFSIESHRIEISSLVFVSCRTIRTPARFSSLFSKRSTVQQRTERKTKRRPWRNDPWRRKRHSTKRSKTSRRRTKKMIEFS